MVQEAVSTDKARQKTYVALKQNQKFILTFRLTSLLELRIVPVRYRGFGLVGDCPLSNTTSTHGVLAEHTLTPGHGGTLRTEDPAAPGRVVW